MDAEIKAVKDAAAKLGSTTTQAKKLVEEAIADLQIKKEAAHKVIDSTYNDLITQALKDILPTNTK